jgi:hypothetical protein
MDGLHVANSYFLCGSQPRFFSGDKFSKDFFPALGMGRSPASFPLAEEIAGLARIHFVGGAIDTGRGGAIRL